MKDMKRELALVTSGVLLGAALAAPAATAALTAQLSSQKFVVDGKPAQIEAYSIGGNNYVRLRDVGRAANFSVTYEPQTNTVRIATDKPYAEEPTSGRVVTLPSDGSKYVPQVGDLIPCDDGTLYEVKDILRWENNCFAPGPLPALPTPSYDWGVFPALELPPVDCRRFQSEYGDDLYVRNLHETLRMAYTVYEAVRNEPEAWRDGKPLTKVSLTIDPADEPYTKYFWPWREEELLKHIRAFPRFHFRVEAWDFYHNHTFLQTQYYVFIG